MHTEGSIRSLSAADSVRQIVTNPVIAGFNPDPSVCCKDGVFYCTTSSFQWWPGLPIYRSHDLHHWELFAYAATEPAKCDLRRIDDGGGVWAPCLSYADGLFWMVFSITSGSRAHAYECRNYVMTAEDPCGPWSDPVYLNASGNDPSLFHDFDGRKWLTNTQQLKTTGFTAHAGVLLQEYDPRSRRLVGYPKNIFVRPQGMIPEGSKLHRHGDHYFLIVAEGGTEYGHMMTVARAKNIEGPYEIHPDNPVLTAANDPENPIQRAGHGDIVQLPDGQVAIVYLASRPVDRHSMLGRETFLTRGFFGDDGWLHLEDRSPRIEAPDFELAPVVFDTPPERDDFDAPTLRLCWNTLRRPYDHVVDLETKPGWLLLRGTPSYMDSREDLALIARRLEHHCFSAETLLEFDPVAVEQLAGLCCYYDSRRFYWLAKQWEYDDGDCLILYAKGGRFRETEKIARVPVNRGRSVRMGVDCDGRVLQFRYAVDGEERWESIGPAVSALILSDEEAEFGDPWPSFGFTGAMVGVAAYDVDGYGPIAAFDWFDYRPRRDAWPRIA